MIIAKKGKLTKPFSQLSWDNLGENKNGWVEVVGGTTENIANKKALAPSTGDKEEAKKNLTTENIANKKEEAPSTGDKEEAKKNLTTENIANKKEEAPVEVPEVTDKKEEAPATDESIDAFIASQKKAAFAELAKANLNKGLIKDYFDVNEVKYKANDNLDAIIELLFENLNGDIELLKTKFSL